jgi:cyclic pyranopterin phosphate synthase
VTDLTHIDKNNNPKMVDVGEKKVTRRMAHAKTSIKMPDSIIEKIIGGDIKSKKGPVFHTAIIAGTMGVKNTSILIPFCHSLNIEKCDIKISINDNDIEIDCIVAITGKTGVEMEALTGATVAALTIYDMCKAISHEMVINETYLYEKTGGKRTIRKGILCN